MKIPSVTQFAPTCRKVLSFLLGIAGETYLDKFTRETATRGREYNVPWVRKGYRLIDFENAEIGGRCTSTGPSPLDLGIGAMA